MPGGRGRCPPTERSAAGWASGWNAPGWGRLSAVDHGGPLIAWMGAVIRRRRGEGGPPGYDSNPWWVRQEHQPAAMASQLRMLAKERSSPGSGTTWRSVVPAERRALITSLNGGAEEQLTQLRGAQRGKTADAARQLLSSLGHATEAHGKHLSPFPEDL